MSFKITQVDRVLKILELLNQGRELCLKQDPLSKRIALLEELRASSYEFEDVDVGLRTLQKDMVYVKKFLGDNLIKRGSCYRLMKKEYLNNFFKDHHKEIRKIFHAIALIDKNAFGYKFKKYQFLLDSIVKNQKEIYLFLEEPFEKLKQSNIKEKLEQFIKDRKYVNIKYKSDKLYNFKRVQMYKIIYHHGNWYVAVLTTQDTDINDGFKLLRLNFIEHIMPCEKAPYHFYKDIKVKDFLENRFQSLFTSFNGEFYKVKIEISQQVARHFKVKKFLKSQRIIGSNNDKLIVEFTINDDMEIIPLLQTWLPYITIIEPQHLKNKLLNNIYSFIEKNELSLN